MRLKKKINGMIDKNSELLKSGQDEVRIEVRKTDDDGNCVIAVGSDQNGGIQEVLSMELS